MPARSKTREWLEDIREQVLELARLEKNVQELKEQSQTTGSQFGSIGHASGPKDASGPIIKAIEAENELDVKRAKVNARIDRALLVLYGRDGRGGLAKLKGYMVADCICGYYLQGMTWPQVASAFGWPDEGLDSKDGPQLCKRRAYRGIEKMELLGAEAVMDW